MINAFRVAIASLLFAPAAWSQSTLPTAAEVIAKIKGQAGIEMKPTTVDTFKAGDPSTRVTGIAVTMMATLNVLKAAVARGDNLIITHEPTFYSHRDTIAVLELENDKVLAAKRKYISDHGLIVWRFHDIPHQMKPDIIRTGIVRALGWQSSFHAEDQEVFDIRRASVRALAKEIGEKLGARAVRISGDADAMVSRAVLTQGFPGFVANRHAIQRGSPDVVIIGEDHEWETIEYVVDAISAGQIKAMIVLGHIASEQLGMDEVARWLRPLLPGVRIDFIPTSDPFRFSR
jgi:putative NIF3 family GTP cyclohydrolase 1 type 2